MFSEGRSFKTWAQAPWHQMGNKHLVSPAWYKPLFWEQQREKGKETKLEKRYNLWTYSFQSSLGICSVFISTLPHFINTSFTFFILLLPCLYSKTSSSLFPHWSETFLGLMLLLDHQPDLLLSCSTTRLVVESGLLSITAHSSSRQLYLGICPQQSMNLFGPRSWKMAFTGNDPCYPTSSHPVPFCAGSHGEEYILCYSTDTAYIYNWTY